MAEDPDADSRALGLPESSRQDVEKQLLAIFPHLTNRQLDAILAIAEMNSLDVFPEH